MERSLSYRKGLRKDREVGCYQRPSGEQFQHLRDKASGTGKKKIEKEDGKEKMKGRFSLFAFDLVLARKEAVQKVGLHVWWRQRQKATLHVLLHQDYFSSSQQAIGVALVNFLHGSPAAQPILKNTISVFVFCRGKEGKWFLLFALSSVFTGLPSCHQDFE